MIINSDGCSAAADIATAINGILSETSERLRRDDTALVPVQGKAAAGASGDATTSVDAAVETLRAMGVTVYERGTTAHDEVDWEVLAGIDDIKQVRQ